MEVKQYNIKRAIVSQIPNIELFDERVIHNKVHYNKFDAVRVIPKGSKGFLIFKKDRTEYYCYFIELLSKKSINKQGGLFINYKNYKKRLPVHRIYKLNCCFDEILACGCGTILYGTLCWNDNINFKTNLKYFVTENVFYFKGKRQNFNGWNNVFENIVSCIKKNIGVGSYNKNSIVVCAPVTKSLPVNINDLIESVSYDIYCMQYINLNNSSYYTKFINKTKKEYIYVKANIQSDIYELFDIDECNMGLCHIPDYKTSVNMNSIFRSIKENDNLDYLEESDDEEEFENISLDKYVNLNKKEIFECVYNKKFGMWVPLRHIDEYEMASKNYNIYKIKY